MKDLNLAEEMIEKAKEAKTVEELLLLAKENKLDLTEERASLYFEKINPKFGQLEDEELDNVSGGGCEPSYEDLGYYIICMNCGATGIKDFKELHQWHEYKCKKCKSTEIRWIKKDIEEV